MNDNVDTVEAVEQARGGESIPTAVSDVASVGISDTINDKQSH